MLIYSEFIIVEIALGLGAARLSGSSWDFVAVFFILFLNIGAC